MKKLIVKIVFILFDLLIIPFIIRKIKEWRKRNAKNKKLQPEDLLIETFRPERGDLSWDTSGVRITHKPTGLKAHWDKEIAYELNRDKALQILTRMVRGGHNEETK